MLGAIVGVLFSFRGGTSYKAASLISLGQPVSPGGVVIAELRDEPAGGLPDRQLGVRAGGRPSGWRGCGPGALRGKVSVAQVGGGDGRRRDARRRR